MSQQGNVGIVGAGAVGAMIGFYLNQAGFKVGFFDRAGPTTKQLRFNLGQDVHELTFSKPSTSLDLCFVTVKSNQLKFAIQQHKFLASIPTVFICNGLVDELLGTNPLEYWQLGTTTIGVSSKEDLSFDIFNNGGCVVWGGSQNPLPIEEQIIESLKDEGFQRTDHADEFRRKKWLFNVAINSLTGYFRLPQNGDLQGKISDLKVIFGEAFQLGGELFGGFDVSKDVLWSDLLKLIQSTKNNENSMARDVRLGRETENEFLAGLVERSRNEYPMLRKINQSLKN